MKNTYIRIISSLVLSFLLFISSLFFLSGCAEDTGNIEPEVFAAAFTTTAMGITEDITQAEVTVDFIRETTKENTVRVSLEEIGVVYGEDYTTVPTAENGTIIMIVPKGVKKTSFTLNRTGIAYESTDKILLKLVEVTGEANALITGNKGMEISFSSIVASGATVDANIGGPTQPNQVFIDLSLQEQSTVARTSWDLGFSTTGNRVILNYSTYMAALATDKTDLNAITAQDTVGLSETFAIRIPGSDAFIDSPDGALTKTAIAEISANAADNKVYIINMGGAPGTGDVELGKVDVASTPRGWKKIRVLQKDGGYLLQYADINATTFEEATIGKNPNRNFSFFSFTTGGTSVEPDKHKWDFALTTSTNVISFGPAAAGAYGFSDFVRTNGVGGTEVAVIKTAEKDKDGNSVATGEKAYEDFSKADLSEKVFLSTENSIGASWRSVFTGTINASIYYIIKDVEGNYFKLKFISMVNDAGERGHTSFVYQHLK